MNHTMHAAGNVQQLRFLAPSGPREKKKEGRKEMEETEKGMYARASYLTERFTSSEPQNLPTDDFYVLKNRRLADI